MKQSPHEDDSKRILDNLVELTSQREQDLLESSLASTLVEVMRVDKVELFACRWVNGVPYTRRRLSAASADGKTQITETSSDSWLPPPIFLYDLLNARWTGTTAFSAFPTVYACPCAAWAASSPCWSFT
ncbi:hypothetical protein JOS77_20920 [Chromobacterium haemolyticum]|nr:hypothetical protein JOS77_20920 [Chromobacterium haemolyticum]